MKTLLDDFSKLPAHVERPPTFMKIAGYPHYENVCSNILAFFMDPEESHGLGTLVLDALASVANITAADEGVGGNVSVEREVVTYTGSRIDILIESDAHAVLIENKFYAPVDNPFPAYADYLDKVADERRKHKLLLTIFPTDEGSRWGFANLTYAEFVDQIRSMLGHYVSGADTRYLTLLLDFLNTLESLQEGTRMNQEFVKLLSERTDDIQDLLTKVKEFKDELRNKVRELGALIEVGEYENVRQWFWRKGTWLLDDLVHDIHVSEDLLVAIDTFITPHGWNIRIWPRRGDRSKLRDLLQRLDIPLEEEGPHFVPHAPFAYSENLDRIKPILQDLVDRIATGRAEGADPQLGSAASDPGST